MSQQPHILMCPPDFYGIEYEINPWMNTERQADHPAAVEQWNVLRSHIEAAGARVSLLEPVQGLPDLVFTANAAMVFARRMDNPVRQSANNSGPTDKIVHPTAVLARFRHSQRQGEEPHDRRWLTVHGFEVLDPPANFSFEGAGDALFCGDTLYAGYRMRSDAAGHQAIGQMLGVRVIPLELVNPYYYHLDTCFCPLAEDTAIWFPPAFDDYGQRVIREHVPNLIEATQPEAERFACNAVVIGRNVITNTGCDELHAALRTKDYEPIATPLDEFVKAGGSAKCLTLRLDGEEAVAWKK